MLRLVLHNHGLFNDNRLMHNHGLVMHNGVVMHNNFLMHDGMVNHGLHYRKQVAIAVQVMYKVHMVAAAKANAHQSGHDQYTI
jgi:hypothetical protein